MELVTIDTKYVDYLRAFDNKVCYNKDWSHSRPYIGVLFNIKQNLYFAPLTSSGKGKKLKDFPKPESTTFYPIKNCEYGGINFNNMIPVISSVYSRVDMTIQETDSKKERNYKLLLINQLSYLSKNAIEKHLKRKALALYSMKTKNQLYENYDRITCDFKLLEEKAKLYQA